MAIRTQDERGMPKPTERTKICLGSSPWRTCTAAGQRRAGRDANWCSSITSNLL